MTEPKNGVKTLGIKVPDALHVQFTLVAQLEGISLNDGAVRAVELYVATKKAEPGFNERAQAALDEIEKEAAVRRGAIQGLLGSDDATGDTVTADKPGTTRGRKTDS